MQETLKTEMNQMLQMGSSVLSGGEWGSFSGPSSKEQKEKSFMCGHMNAISKFDSYPMVRIDELIEWLGKAKHQITIDPSKEYWKLPQLEVVMNI